jgi:GAF domain-containing protein
MHISEELLQRSLEQLRRKQADEPAPLEETMASLTESVTSMFELTGAGLMLVDDDQLLHSVLATDPVGWDLEQAQEKVGEGPCVDTLVYGEVVSTEDVLSDPRWSSLPEELRDTAIGGVLGVPIRLGGTTVGALNVFVDEPHEWDESDHHALTTYGAVLESLLTSALLAENRDTVVKQLQEALDSRVIIERCVGMLMGRHGIDAVTAFNRLRGQARSSRRKVHDLAHEILSAAG